LNDLGEAYRNKVGRPQKVKISKREKRKIGIPFYTTESEKETIFDSKLKRIRLGPTLGG
jgi:hypothetical protein